MTFRDENQQQQQQQPARRSTRERERERDGLCQVASEGVRLMASPLAGGTGPLGGGVAAAAGGGGQLGRTSSFGRVSVSGTYTQYYQQQQQQQLQNGYANGYAGAAGGSSTGDSASCALPLLTQPASAAASYSPGLLAGDASNPGGGGGGAALTAAAGRRSNSHQAKAGGRVPSGAAAGPATTAAGSSALAGLLAQLGPVPPQQQPLHQQDHQQQQLQRGALPPGVQQLRAPVNMGNYSTNSASTASAVNGTFTSYQNGLSGAPPSQLGLANGVTNRSAAPGVSRASGGGVHPGLQLGSLALQHQQQTQPLLQQMQPHAQAAGAFRVPGMAHLVQTSAPLAAANASSLPALGGRRYGDPLWGPDDVSNSGAGTGAGLGSSGSGAALLGKGLSQPSDAGAAPQPVAQRTLDQLVSAAAAGAAAPGGFGTPGAQHQRVGSFGHSRYY